jgi:hypothetical protein
MKAPEGSVVFDKPLNGLVKVVHENQVADLSRVGWAIIAFYQETQLMPCQEQEPNENNQYGHGPTYSLMRYKPSTFTRFVMQLDEQSALTQAAEDLKTCQSTFSAANAELTKTKKDLEVMGQGRLKAEQEAERLRSERTRNLESVDRATKIYRKLEDDIAKIRKALGELKLKEILGS